MSDACKGKKLQITATSNHTFGLEKQDECKDYLLFDFGEMSVTEKLCGTDLSTYRKEINHSSFLAYFWTDDKHNKGGFQLSVTCTNSTIDDDGSGGFS